MSLVMLPVVMNWLNIDKMFSGRNLVVCLQLGILSLTNEKDHLYFWQQLKLVPNYDLELLAQFWQKVCHIDQTMVVYI